MQVTELRWIEASVRPEYSQGNFHPRVFATSVPLTGSYHTMAAAAIADIRKQGYETHHIIAHASQRSLL